jgi:hypothetical protein
MADLRIKYLEDYAGGLLNVSRQELSSNGEVLSQDGFLTDSTIFVEDGTGVKSGLKLGVGLAECLDPTTNLGIVNVRYADRTYAKVREVKIFTMAIASAQAALSESITESLGVLEGVLDSTNARLDTNERAQTNLQTELTTSIAEVNSTINNLQLFVEGIETRVLTLESSNEDPNSNISLGYNSLTSLTTGIRNLSIGYNAGRLLKDGTSNTFYGFNAGANLIAGSNNVFIGSDSRGTSSNEIVLGNYLHKVIKSNTDVYTPVLSKSSEFNNLTQEDFTYALTNFKALKVKKIYKSDTLYDLSIDFESLKANVDTPTLNVLTYNQDSDYVFLSKAKLMPLLLSVVQQLVARVEALEENV